MLRAGSIGVSGTATQVAGGGAESVVQGRLGVLEADRDFDGAQLRVVGGTDGSVGSITVGGSILGGADAGTGSIEASGPIGKVRIKGDIVGGDGFRAGWVASDAAIEGLTLDGSLIGGGGLESGEVLGAGTGAVVIRGSIVGGAGGNWRASAARATSPRCASGARSSAEVGPAARPSPATATRATSPSTATSAATLPSADASSAIVRWERSRSVGPWRAVKGRAAESSRPTSISSE